MCILGLSNVGDYIIMKLKEALNTGKACGCNTVAEAISTIDFHQHMYEPKELYELRDDIKKYQCIPFSWSIDDALSLLK